MKKVIFFIILSTLFTLSEIKYLSYDIDLIDNPFRYKTSTECGLLTSNFTELQNIKRGTRTDYYIRVNYDGLEKIENVTPETFYGCNIGQIVCFDRYEGISMWLIPTALINIISIIVIPLSIVVFMIMKVFDWNW